MSGSGLDLADVVLRLFVDVVCVGMLAAMIAQRRPRRGLFVVFSTFNLALFCVLTVISAQHIGPAVGFGLFALLSIVRLRSEPFSNQELSYFFSALAFALINGIRLGNHLVPVLLDVVLLLALFLIDHPSLHRSTTRQRVTLDIVVNDPAELRAELAHRLGTEIVEATVVDVDYVREIMRINVRTLQPAGVAEPSGTMTDLAVEAGA
ncbi:DUF4956 domain-containing protein [Baekduia soli]|uniref:DUF4956 domain-containing protein n=1 Tax=Baekduia soli TaxID=496014 RepID=A0A5B8U7H6_9ACTN|nr:DUF4956 domain-containing protein [Baekduia soli]QEC48778.1 DUF4956 domain-containing protein [Baekduia soli]